MPPAPAPRARPDRATRLLDAFRARFGIAHELFACHAAFPAALTPELAYQLWAAFRADIHGEPLGVPWIAVADLLLSPLCAEIGEELYEMAPDVRAVLRRRLLDDPRLGPRRAGDVAELLFDIAADGLHSEDSYERTLAQAQRLTALAHSAPERAATVLAGMLEGIGADDHAGWMRMASLMEGLAEPLAAFPALAQLAPAMAARGRGEEGPIAAFVREHCKAVEVGGKRLVVPEPEPEQPPAEAPRRLRVLVVGTALPQLDDRTTWAAEELGRALADAGHSLLAGSWPGVDHTVASSFVARLDDRGEAANERLTRIVYPGEGPAFRRGRIVELDRTTDAAWTREALQECDAVVVIGGADFVAQLVLAAEDHGKPVIPLPWTGGAAHQVAEAMRAQRRRPDAPATMQPHARRLLEGEPRFRSDARYLIERAMAVLALHDPAEERTYRAYSRGMARLLISLERPAEEGPPLLRDLVAGLFVAAGTDWPVTPGGPGPALREIEATLPAMAHWLVEDFLGMCAVGGAGDEALSLLTPLLARHARHLASHVIGRVFDERSAPVERWLLRWGQEARQVLPPEEYQRWGQEIAVRWAESYVADSSSADPDRIAELIVRVLRASELTPQVSPLLPLLAQPRPAARVAGYLMCRAYGVPVSAEALDASLQLEEQEVEERGATGALRQLLKCYEVVPEIEHGAAARLAAAGLARMARLLEGQERADAEGSSRRAIRALLDGRFKEAAALLDRLDAAARRYEEIRLKMPSDTIRTELLDDLVHMIGDTLRDARLTPDELSARFKAGGDGDRIIVLSSALLDEDPASFPPVLQVINEPRSAFEQYWALQAASGMLRKLERSSLEALRATLQRQLGGAAASKIKEDRLGVLGGVAQGVLKDIADLLGRSQRLPLLDMVPIPAGRFWMGSEKGDSMGGKDEHPRHEVELSAFMMARVPVTQRQYNEVMGENPSTSKGDDLPVIDVTWMDAIRFCNTLSVREGLTPVYQIHGDQVYWDRSSDGYRLPTESEWEYAARGTDGRTYPWGNVHPTDQLCWNGEGNDLGRRNRHGPSPVGSYPGGASPFGLLDMAGNVWEWCWDYYGSYQEMMTLTRDPVALTPSLARVLRGGSWVNASLVGVRATKRGRNDPSRCNDNAGFRCAQGRIQ